MKYTKLISYVSIILAVIITASCTKLDEDLYDHLGSNYPENDAQIANLSVNAYKEMQGFIDDNGWWFLAQEISSDELCAPTRATDWYDGGKWLDMHKHDWSNDTEAVNTMWGAFWGGITVSNQTLDILRQLEQIQSIKDKIAEVEVLRTFYYYLLIDNYGDVPYLVTANFEEGFAPMKVSREVIYDSLIITMERNLPLLKAVDNKLMATRNMGFALLTKLYLNAEIYKGSPEWEKAGQYCDSILAGPYSLAPDVKSPFATNNEKSSEIIFSIPFDEDKAHGFRLHMRTLHYQHNLTFDMPVGPWNGFAVVPTHFDTYEDNDLRKEASFLWGRQLTSSGDNIIENITAKPLDIDPYLPALYMVEGDFTPEQIRTTGARISKYEIKMGAKENLSNDFPLFRLSDFYLMKAEIEIRLGRSGDEWVNPIRERAEVEPFVGCTLEQLLAERGREMFVEGHRRQDLIRFGKWNDAWWEKAAHGNEKNTFPIPQWAIDANPNLGN